MTTLFPILYIIVIWNRTFLSGAPPATGFQSPTLVGCRGNRRRGAGGQGLVSVQVGVNHARNGVVRAAHDGEDVPVPGSSDEGARTAGGETHRAEIGCAPLYFASGLRKHDLFILYWQKHISATDMPRHIHYTSEAQCRV